MCADNRIGSDFYKSGIGYGGSCFPKDTLAVMEMGDDLNAPCLVNTAVHEINQRQRRWFADRIVEHFDGSLAGKRIAMWGLAFKPQTDDVRDAPSIDIAKTLIGLGATITAFDPEASDTFLKECADVQIANDMYDATENADALVICTEWKQFLAPDFDMMKQRMNDPVIFDGRNLYALEDMKNRGFQYFSVGRPDILSKTTPVGCC
jgi:UDPglucose 6-dehydrogenase